VRYAFTVPGQTDTFTLEDEVGRTNLWESLDDESQLQSVLETGTINVVYWPANPRVNRAVRRGGAQVGDSGGGVLGGLLLAGLSLRIRWLEIKGRGDEWRAIRDLIRF
jgi:hypothetical protein